MSVDIFIRYFCSRWICCVRNTDFFVSPDSSRPPTYAHTFRYSTSSRKSYGCHSWLCSQWRFSGVFLMYYNRLAFTYRLSLLINELMFLVHGSSICQTGRRLVCGWVGGRDKRHVKLMYKRYWIVVQSSPTSVLTPISVTAHEIHFFVKLKSQMKFNIYDNM